MPTTRRADPGPGWIVFSDLDGTLLTHDRYEWSAARPGLAELARRGIPLVLASSKTRREIELWRRRLGIGGAFISENGGALYVPPGLTPAPLPGSRGLPGYRRIEFGTRYPQLRAALRELERETGVALRGFGDMAGREIARLTGLAGEDLAAARRREYDEPFLPAERLDEEQERRLVRAAETRGLRVTRGGRFHHLLGASSKGRAAGALLAAFAAAGRPPLAVGLGDGPNDLELLEAMDRAIVVARPDGSHAPELRRALPRARFTRGLGPEGFTEGLLAELALPA
jgi:mannosyl-3-phosphoglycerate phosphatase